MLEKLTIAGYILIAILVACLVFNFSDPYSHNPLWLDIGEALLIGAFWLFALFWVLIRLIFYW